MNKLKLNSEIILDKEFDIDIKGYSALQVDMFLDVVYEDYNTFQEVLTDYEDYVTKLKENINELQDKIENLIKNQTITNEIIPTEQINSLDILKRLSRLEQEVYNKE